MVEWVGFLYAALVAAGGVVGYLKAGSVPSLAAGLICGFLAAFGSATQNYHLLFGLGVVLGGVMGYRAISGGKFMPSGIVAVLSVVLLLRCVIFFSTKTRIH